MSQPRQKIVRKSDGSKAVLRGGRIVGNLPSDAARTAPTAAYVSPDTALGEAAASVAPAYADAYAAFRGMAPQTPTTLQEWSTVMRAAGDARLDGKLSRADHAVLTLQADEWLRANNYSWEELERGAPTPPPATDPSPPAPPLREGEFRGSRWTPGYRPPADIARDIRNDLKTLRAGGELPRDVKISVRTHTYAGGCSIHVSLSGWPEERIWQDGVDAYGMPTRRETEEAAALRKKVEEVRNSYNRDTSDPSMDYFNADYLGVTQWDMH